MTAIWSGIILGSEALTKIRAKDLNGNKVNVEDGSAVMSSMLKGNKVINMHSAVEELDLAA